MQRKESLLAFTFMIRGKMRAGRKEWRAGGREGGRNTPKVYP